jgi:DNA-directed RNA polymerase specialized sigma24 family protein
VDLDDPIGELPAKYAAALRMRARGLTGAEIAAQLDVPLDSVDTLLQLAEAKLAALRQQDT